MLNNIIKFSVKNKLIIGLMVLGLIVYGAYQTSKLPIDAVPDITNNQVQIITTVPALGATDIERLITFPIEQANSNIPGLKEIRSFSRFGLSLVTIVFNDNVDVYWARQQVSERLLLLQSQIPKGFGMPTLAPVTTGLGEIYQYVIKTKKGYENMYSLSDLRTIQDWTVRRSLIGTEGVADVSTFGGALKQFEVAVNSNKLKSFNLSISDVFKALENNNQNTGGAYIEKGPTVLYIRSEGLVGSNEDIEKIVVKNNTNGIPVLIRDVAEIKTGIATRYGAMCYNGEGEVAGAVVMMLRGENSSVVIKKVKEKIEQIRKILPEGIEIEPFLDRSKMVNNAIGTVEQNLLEGALIVLCVLVLFLGNIRAGFIVASVIPLAMLFAIIMMNLFGVSGNLMSLGALDFGLIVDGAVIIVEAVLHRLAHSKQFAGIGSISQEEMDNEVNESSSRMMNAAAFGQVIILIVYLPILSLEGIEGKMFGPMAQTVAFAILGAFILSLTYVPMMTALFISKKISIKSTFSDKLMGKVENAYRQVLVKSLQFKKMVLFIALGLFGLASIILSNMGGEFIPKLEEGDFAVETRVLTGSNLNTSIQSTQQTSKLLLAKFPEIIKIVTKIGSGEIPTDPMPLEASDMMIILKDKQDWTSAESFDDLAEKMSIEAAKIPGITVSFQYPVQMRFNELMTGAKQDVVCKIFGENLDTLAHFAERLGEITKKVEGVKDLYVETVTGMPQIVIKYNRDVMAKYGLNISEINNTVNAAFAGAVTGQVYEGERRFDMVVRLENEQRKNLSDVQNLLISTNKGIQIPLYQVAEVDEIEGPNQIQREEAKRRIIVGFNVREKDVQTVVKDLKKLVDKEIKFPAGYYVTYGGAFENLQAAKQRLSIAVPIALLLIFMMLYFAFNSLGVGMLIFTAIPLSAIGGIIALWLRQMPFSISAGVGFIALFGVAVLNGIVLISEFNRLKKEGMQDVIDIVFTGTKIRLRPVLMTAAVASLGFLPMALSNGAGAEVQRPLATVVMGGLISATLLTLLVLPILYVMFENKNNKNNKTKITIAPIFILVSLLFSIVSFAQTPNHDISLEKALSIAEKNNYQIQGAIINEQSNESLKRTWFDSPKANISFEYGQINTIYNDNRFGLSQSFAFPTVYVAHKKNLSESYLATKAQTKLSKLDVNANVKLIFYEILVLRQKEKLLQYADSLYALFEQKARLKLKLGESNILEKTTAESQRQQINIQLKMLNSDIEIALKHFNQLLNDKFQYEPIASNEIYNLFSIADTLNLSQHPLMLAELHYLNANKYKWKTERNKLLPDLMLGYNNMTIIGLQNIDGKETYFNSEKRFSSFMVGAGIPLFFGAQSSRINASKLQFEKAQNDFNMIQQKLKTDVLVMQDQVKKYQSSFDYYYSEGLNHSKTIANTANLQFNNGDIDYLQFTTLLNQSIGIQSEYLNALQNLNQSKIKLDKLLGNN
jgi:cobalt-zinc-cadmium resistance protein CzcA